MNFMGNMWEKLTSLCEKHHIVIPRAPFLEIDDGCTDEDIEDSINRLKRMGFNTDTGKKISAPSRGTLERPWWPSPHEIPTPPVTIPRMEPPSPRSMFHLQEQVRDALSGWVPYSSRLRAQRESDIQRGPEIRIGSTDYSLVVPTRPDYDYRMYEPLSGYRTGITVRVSEEDRE